MPVVFFGRIDEISPFSDGMRKALADDKETGMKDEMEYWWKMVIKTEMLRLWLQFKRTFGLI